MAGKKATKTYRVLAYVARSGEAGVRFSDIQRFIVEMNGLRWSARSPYTAFRKDGNLLTTRRKYRGYWATNLSGDGSYCQAIARSLGQSSRMGLLHEFCVKGPDGRWRINSLVTGSVVLSLRTEKIVFRTKGKK